MQYKGAKKVLDIYKSIEGSLIDDLAGLGIISLDHSMSRDVKDSLVLSSISLCVPGIVHNVRKIQQSECGYALCLLDAEQGRVPASYCEYAKGVSYCEIYASELFNFVPFGLVAKDVSFSINQYLKSPITIAGGFFIDAISREIPSVRVILKLQKYNEDLLPMIGITFSVTDAPAPVDYCALYEQRRND